MGIPCEDGVHESMDNDEVLVVHKGRFGLYESTSGNCIGEGGLSDIGGMTFATEWRRIDSGDVRNPPTASAAPPPRKDWSDIELIDELKYRMQSRRERLHEIQNEVDKQLLIIKVKDKTIGVIEENCEDLKSELQRVSSARDEERIAWQETRTQMSRTCLVATIVSVLLGFGVGVFVAAALEKLSS